MAAKIFLSFKIIAIILYSGGVTTVAGAVGNEFHGQLLFTFFSLMLFIPEISIILSPSFRNWLRQGIEDADGKMNRSDVFDLVAHINARLMSIIFGMMSLSMTFMGLSIDWHVYLMPFFGSFGIEGLIVIKGIYNKQK